jgi:hypothetical protein
MNRSGVYAKAPACSGAAVSGGPRLANAASPVIVDSYLRISAVIDHADPLASAKWRLVQLRTLFWRHDRTGQRGLGRPKGIRTSSRNAGAAALFASGVSTSSIRLLVRVGRADHMTFCGLSCAGAMYAAGPAIGGRAGAERRLVAARGRPCSSGWAAQRHSSAADGQAGPGWPTLMS